MIESGYQDALAELQQARQAAQQLRDEFLQSQVTRYTALNEQGKAQLFQKIQFIRNPHKSEGLATLKVPIDPNIADPEAMKSFLDDDTAWQTI